MSSNCNECGRKTPKKVYICNSCINFDPDYSDYRTEWEIWDEKAFLAAEKEMAWQDLRAQLLKEDEEFEEQLWMGMDLDLYDTYDAMYDWEKEEKEERTALHALTGN